MDEFQHLEPTLRATTPYIHGQDCEGDEKFGSTRRRVSKVGRLDTHHDGLRFAKQASRSGTH
jgi:hypothetical protein